LLLVPAPVRPPGDAFAPRALPPGEVHVWHADLDAGAADESVLTEEERERARRMFGRARPRYARSRELLRHLLAAYTRTPPGEIALRIGSEGKPRLETGEVRFNLAHAGGAWVAAFALGRELGVDVERVDRDVDRDRVAARIFAPGEIETIRRLAGRAKTLAFFRCWTAREALVKLRGEGLFTLGARFEVDVDPDHPLAVRALTPGAEVYRLAEVPVRPGHCAALATEGELARALAFVIPQPPC